MRAGKVEFITEGERLVRVEVRLDYTPRSKAAADQELRRAQATLSATSRKYRVFVRDRCERLQCRPD